MPRCASLAPLWLPGLPKDALARDPGREQHLLLLLLQELNLLLQLLLLRLVLPLQFLEHKEQNGLSRWEPRGAQGTGTAPAQAASSPTAGRRARG